MSVRVLSTENLPLAERYHLYQSALWKCFGRLELQPEKISDFTCQMEEASFVDVGMYGIKASGHRVERAERIARLEGERHLIKVALQIQGHACYEQDGHTLTLGPGEWSVYDMSKPYRADFQGDVEILLLVFPFEKLDSKRFDLRDVILKRRSMDEGLSGLTYQFICNAFQKSRIIDRRSEVDIVEMMSNLIRLTMVDVSGGTIISAPKEILCERIKNYIAANLRDPGLSVTHIADALRCTPRYLQRAFETQNFPISSYIWRQRIDRCRKDLSDPALRKQSITDIAFSWGFSSSAHFSRMFKEQFGISPNMCRGREPSLTGILTE